MAHTCKAIVIPCMDFRFQSDLRKKMEELGLIDNYDLHAVAGAALNITRPKENSDRDFVLRHIEIAVRLHKIRQVILFNHQNCGAYGDEDSKEQHLVDLKKAREIILRFFPQLKVILYYAHLEERGEERKIWFEEVE